MTKDKYFKHDRYALINIDKCRIIAVEGKILLGECRRCAKCCELIKCPHIVYETLDGKTWNSCSIYHDRPVRCALWPQPQDKTPEGCGFYYKDEKDEE